MFIVLPRRRRPGGVASIPGGAYWHRRAEVQTHGSRLAGIDVADNDDVDVGFDLVVLTAMGC